MTDTLTDETLSELAEALAVGKNLPTLGLKLGFRRSKVKMYMGINNRNDSFEGTTDMLFDWKEKTPTANQIPDLVKALGDSGLAAFVDEFFPTRASAEPPKRTGQAARKRPRNEEGDNSSMLPSSTVTQETRSGKRRVKDGEIVTLSKILPCENYTALCVALGFGIASSNNIVTKHQLNYSAAFVEILTNWSTKTCGFIQDLDNALVTAELGGLTDQYKM